GLTNSPLCDQRREAPHVNLSLSQRSSGTLKISLRLLHGGFGLAPIKLKHRLAFFDVRAFVVEPRHKETLDFRTDVGVCVTSHRSNAVLSNRHFLLDHWCDRDGGGRRRRLFRTGRATGANQ